uniref:Uncharacterized protein n=1 Tax=Perkinsus chesapeaki TaxID=330153 RepID=A7YXP2_PERCH|nr:unknown [Perkinsus chesapeaki]
MQGRPYDGLNGSRHAVKAKSIHSELTSTTISLLSS